MLTEQHKDLLLKLNKINNEEIDHHGDEVDEIQGKQIAAIDAKLAQQYKLKLDRVITTLKRLDKEDFGLCEECEEEINEKRLRFNPTFNLCVNCAEIAEKRK